MSEPEVVELPNISAEYHYIQRLDCHKCGQPVKGDRRGSRPAKDKRMEDIWDTTCTKCGATRRIILSVPLIDIFGMMESSGDPEK